MRVDRGEFEGKDRQGDDALRRAVGCVVAFASGRRDLGAEVAVMGLLRLLEARLLAMLGRTERETDPDERAPWPTDCAGCQYRLRETENKRDLAELAGDRNTTERECQRLEADLRAVQADRDSWRKRALRAEMSRDTWLKCLGDL